jgi:hypothetical protein
MTGEQCRRRAAICLVLAWALMLHQWVPAALLAAFVAWAVLHKRMDGGAGVFVRRPWRRAWPPPALPLIVALVASAFWFWRSEVALTAKVLPLALDLLGVLIITLGHWGALFARRERLRTVAGEPAPATAVATK